MTKTQITAAVAFLNAALLIKLNVHTMIWMFLLFGAIPGTGYSLPSGVMLMFYGLITWFVFCHSTVRRFLRRNTTKKAQSAPAFRRLSQI